MRIAITGPPQSGKTTLAKALSEKSRDCDQLYRDGIEWSAASERIATWFDEDDPDMVVEGVAVPRALRKWLASHPEGKPIDRLVIITHPLTELTKGQMAMAKGIVTVLDGIVVLLHKRGVEIVTIKANADLVGKEAIQAVMWKSEQSQQADRNDATVDEI